MGDEVELKSVFGPLGRAAAVHISILEGIESLAAIAAEKQQKEPNVSPNTLKRHDTGNVASSMSAAAAASTAVNDDDLSDEHWIMACMCVTKELLRVRDGKTAVSIYRDYVA